MILLRGLREALSKYEASSLRASNNRSTDYEDFHRFENALRVNLSCGNLRNLWKIFLITQTDETAEDAEDRRERNLSLRFSAISAV
jgi:hypothetical protein